MVLVYEFKCNNVRYTTIVVSLSVAFTRGVQRCPPPCGHCFWPSSQRLAGVD